MKVTVGQEEVMLIMSRLELFLLAGCANETLEAVEDWEFSIRLGADRAEVEKLAADLQRAIQELPEDG